ncbi:primary-amine oxidase [Natronomonas sp.]|uniref:primary-amine oxidase n=1 Tax=Natronomonas sp. TaxID=2184060 RepID=UPI003976A129
MPTESETVHHPVDPLTPEEISGAKRILESERSIREAFRYIKIVLKEPLKDEMERYHAADVAPDRRSYIIVRDTDKKTTYEAVVSLDSETVVSWEEKEGIQPSITIGEFDEFERTVKSNSEWRDAVAKRGVEDFDLVTVDAWSAGYHLVPDDIDPTRRLAHGMTFVKTAEDANPYARPLDGIHVWGDLDDREVLKVVDRGVKEANVIDNLEDAPYREAHRDLREDLKPYNVDQPEGPSWDVDGRNVEWQNWHVRIGWTQQEGLVLHEIGYEDDGTARPVINRASCVEMAVPYGSRGPDHNWKNAFDLGEYNIGRLANPLKEGCDCLGYMRYFDAVMNDDDGEVKIIPNAVCLHEEDYGTLWKHTDWRTENTEVRRNRRLVISFVATVGNYDYEFNWYLYQDGSLEGQVRLTGVDSAGLIGPNESVSGFSEEIAPRIKGMVHQHFFNFRLDMDVDGGENNLYRVENTALSAGPDGVKNEWPGDPSEINPAGQAFYAEKTQLTTEKEAKERTNPHDGRYWQVENPNKTNKLDQPTGYRLLPGESVTTAAHPGSNVYDRSTFIDYHLWATPYAEDERFPAGEYPNQNPGGDGLPAWTEENRGLDEEDLVLWYTLGVNHITRPEDWPILPVHISSFKLEPVNFFDENPSMDVPPEHVIKNIAERRAEKYEDPDSVARSDDD